MDKERLLSHLVTDDERIVGSRAIDAASGALRDGKPKATTFLDPLEREVATGVLGSILEVRFRSYGGFRSAERQRLVVYPEYYLTELIEIPIRAVEASGRFEASPSHRDCLGSLTGLGIDRRQLGDILMNEKGCQVIVASESLEFILAEWTQIGSVAIGCEEIDFERLNSEPERVKELRSTVASLRLDAVAAAGFGASRTKMAREIRAERVKVNWRIVSNPAADVAEGDVISMRGRGRVHLESVDGPTRKGRTSILLKRLM